MAKHKYKYKVEVEPQVIKRRKIIKELIIWTLETVFVIFAAYYISFFWLEKTSVVGTSMQTTLSAGDTILIDKFTYMISSPKRFDIIVFKQSNKEHNYYDIKRIIGLPGETVRIDGNGDIYINDNLINDIVIADKMTNGGLASTGITLDDDEYFVVGDNRNYSEDSRFANVGNVIKDDIIGKAFVKLNPFTLINEVNIKKDETER